MQHQRSHERAAANPWAKENPSFSFTACGFHAINKRVESFIIECQCEPGRYAHSKRVAEPWEMKTPFCVCFFIDFLSGCWQLTAYSVFLSRAEGFMALKSYWFMVCIQRYSFLIKGDVIAAFEWIYSVYIIGIFKYAKLGIFGVTDLFDFWSVGFFVSLNKI